MNEKVQCNKCNCIFYSRIVDNYNPYSGKYNMKTYMDCCPFCGSSDFKRYGVFDLLNDNLNENKAKYDEFKKKKLEKNQEKTIEKNKKSNEKKEFREKRRSEYTEKRNQEAAENMEILIEKYEDKPLKGLYEALKHNPALGVRIHLEHPEVLDNWTDKFIEEYNRKPKQGLRKALVEIPALGDRILKARSEVFDDWMDAFIKEYNLNFEQGLCEALDTMPVLGERMQTLRKEVLESWLRDFIQKYDMKPQQGLSIIDNHPGFKACITSRHPYDIKEWRCRK